MFKLLNLIATVFLIYDFLNKSTAFELATNGNNYGGMVFSGLYLLIDTVLIGFIYVTVFGGSEIYVTTQSVNQAKKED